MRPRGNQPALIDRIKQRAGHRCEGCGAAAGDESERTGRPMKLVVHHRIRVKDGGTDDPENLVLLCDDCHHTEHH